MPKTDNINVGDTIYLRKSSGWSGWYAKKYTVTRKTPTGKITVGDIRFTENLREIGPKRRQYRQRGATANLSRNHPDYGMTVAQHESAKAARRANQEQPQ